MNGKSTLGILLVVVGGIALLKFVGIHVGAIFGFFLPFILIGLGIFGWMNNKKLIGGIVAVIGGMMLLGKLGPIIMLLLAIGLIVVGINLFKKEKSRVF